MESAVGAVEGLEVWAVVGLKLSGIAGLEVMGIAGLRDKVGLWGCVVGLASLGGDKLGRALAPAITVPTCIWSP